MTSAYIKEIIRERESQYDRVGEAEEVVLKRAELAELRQQRRESNNIDVADVLNFTLGTGATAFLGSAIAGAEGMHNPEVQALVAGISVAIGVGAVINGREENRNYIQDRSAELKNDLTHAEAVQMRREIQELKEELGGKGGGQER